MASAAEAVIGLRRAPASALDGLPRCGPEAFTGALARPMFFETTTIDNTLDERRKIQLQPMRWPRSVAAAWLAVGGA